MNNKNAKKQFFTSMVCLALLLIMFIGSSIAYFSDTKSNVNVMVAGRISIKQTQNGESGFTEVILMPTMEVADVVKVENDGNQPCYARTIFAFEDTANGSVLAHLQLSFPEGVQIVIPSGDDKIQFTVKKDGVTTTYTVGYYLYDAQLAAGGSYTCLNAITLSGSADNTWREEVGDYYEVFILSQATQVTGLGDAANAALNQVFGEITAANTAKWFASVLDGTVADDGTEVTVNH